MAINIPVPKDTFVISKLPQILSNDIDAIDSLLVSDYHAVDKRWYTKKFTIQQLVDYLTKQNCAVSVLIDTSIAASTRPNGKISNAIFNQISAETEDNGIIDMAIQTQVSAALSAIDSGGAFD